MAWQAPAEDVTGEDGVLDPALAPAAPEGGPPLGRLEAERVRLRRRRRRRGAGDRDPAAGQRVGLAMYAGYLALDEARGPLSALPAESQFSRGLDWQNIGYSFQWVAFGVFFLYLWWRSVRTAYRDEPTTAARRSRGCSPRPPAIRPTARTTPPDSPPLASPRNPPRPPADPRQGRVTVPQDAPLGKSPPGPPSPASAWPPSWRASRCWCSWAS